MEILSLRKIFEMTLRDRVINRVLRKRIEIIEYLLSSLIWSKIVLQYNYYIIGP